jgi:hypothetical protein
MSVNVHDGILVVEGFDGQQIGIGTGNPSMELYVGESAASFAGDVVGFGVWNAPAVRLEIRGEGVKG